MAGELVGVCWRGDAEEREHEKMNNKRLEAASGL